MNDLCEIDKGEEVEEKMMGEEEEEKMVSEEVEEKMTREEVEEKVMREVEEKVTCFDCNVSVLPSEIQVTTNKHF